MTKIITVYSLKGGCGKTTLTVLMAQYLKAKGYSVTLIDSDTHQKSLSDWANNTAGDKIPCYLIQNTLTKDDLNTLNTDFVLIDGTPRTNAYIKQVLALSDYVVIPVQPTQMNLSSLLQTNHLQMLDEVKVQNPKIKIRVVINGKTQYNVNSIQEMKPLLENVGLLYHSSLGLRKAFVIDYQKPFMQYKNSVALNELGYLVDTLIH